MPVEGVLNPVNGVLSPNNCKGGIEPVDKERKSAFAGRVSDEPFAGLLGIRLVEVGDGYAVCEMAYKEAFDNILGMAHGGAISPS